MSIPRLPLVLAGTRVATEGWHLVRAPHDGRPLAEVAMGTPDDAARAVHGAVGAQSSWAALSPTVRAAALGEYARALDGAAEELAGLVHDEVGKPVAEATAEVARAIEVVHHFAAEAARIETILLPDGSISRGSWVRPVPIGVVAAITPWNFPVALLIWKLAPALAAGCAVVSKPAIEAPLAARRLCEIADEILPDGLVACLTGDGPLLGEALATHPRVDKVAFTGSRRVAETLAGWASPRLKALSLELGGHGALVVLPDADLETAAEVATVQGYVNAGQACYSVNRVIVPRGRASELTARIRERIARLELGPLVTERGLARHTMLLEDARAKGATVEGGETISGRRVAPALVTEPRPGTLVVDEEPFTPIVSVIAVDDVDAAVAEANRPDYGLVNYLCGGELGTTLRVAERLRSGTVVINGWRVVVPHAPFSGWRGSGVGAELGRPGLEAFLRWQHLRVLS